MEVNVINLEGVIIEQIKLPTKTTPQCVSKFQYLYNHAIQGIKVYNPNNYIDYKLYVDNLNDSIFYLVDPNSNITLDYAIFQLTIELPVNSKPTHGSYTVQSGDTCNAIAKNMCGSDSNPQKVICNFDACDDLIINKSIIVYDCGGKKTNCPPPLNKDGSYTVLSGDTCDKIAWKLCDYTTNPKKAICDYSSKCPNKSLRKDEKIYYDCSLTRNKCPTPAPPTPPTPPPTPISSSNRILTISIRDSFKVI
jgi:hypothetical protein